MPDTHIDVLDAVARVIPPATVSFLNLSNVCLSTAIYALTTVYILFQIIILFPKVVNTFKRIGGTNDQS